jgi:catechol-2,3-dioxygenase
MSFCGGNCFKYLYRAGKKGATVEDLKKAAWYAKRAQSMREVVSDEASEAIFGVTKYREGNILEAMVSIECNEWDWAEKNIKAEIARLESEQ